MLLRYAGEVAVERGGDRVVERSDHNDVIDVIGRASDDVVTCIAADIVAV